MEQGVFFLFPTALEQKNPAKGHGSLTAWSWQPEVVPHSWPWCYSGGGTEAFDLF